MSNWFTRKLDQANDMAARALDSTVGRPDFLKNADRPSEAIAKVEQKVEEIKQVVVEKTIEVAKVVNENVVQPTKDAIEFASTHTIRETLDKTNEVARDTVDRGLAQVGLERPQFMKDAAIPSEALDSAARTYESVKSQAGDAIEYARTHTVRETLDKANEVARDTLDRGLAEVGLERPQWLKEAAIPSEAMDMAGRAYDSTVVQVTSAKDFIMTHSATETLDKINEVARESIDRGLADMGLERPQWMKDAAVPSEAIATAGRAYEDLKTQAGETLAQAQQGLADINTNIIQPGIAQAQQGLADINTNIIQPGIAQVEQGLADINTNVIQPGMQKASEIGTIVKEKAEDVLEIGKIAVGMDGPSEAAGATQAERDKQMARSQRANETNSAVVAGADATIQVYKDAAKYADSKIEGVDELLTGDRSTKAVKDYMDTKQRVDDMATKKDDTGLMSEYKKQVDGRLNVLEERKKTAEGKGDTAGVEAAEKQIEAAKKMSEVKLEPGKQLSDEQRTEIAKATKVTAGLNASAEVSRLTGKAMGAAKGIEDGMIMTAQIVANVAAPGVGGLVVSQAVGIADQAGVMGKPVDTGAGVDANRHGGAIAKVVTGQGEKVTWKDVVNDGVDVALAVIPVGKDAAKPVVNAVEGQVVKAVENQAIKTVEGEVVKKVEKTLVDRAVDYGKGKIKGEVKDFLKEETAKALENVTGNAVISKVVTATTQTVAQNTAKAVVEQVVPDVPVMQAVVGGAMIAGANGQAAPAAAKPAAVETPKEAPKPAAVEAAPKEAPAEAKAAAGAVTQEQASKAAKAMDDYGKGKGSLEAAKEGQKVFGKYIDQQIQANAGDDEKSAKLLDAQRKNIKTGALLEEDERKGKSSAGPAAKATTENPGVSGLVEIIVKIISEVLGINIGGMMDKKSEAVAPTEAAKTDAPAKPVEAAKPDAPAKPVEAAKPDAAAKPVEAAKTEVATPAGAEPTVKEITAAVKETRAAIDTKVRQEMGIAADAASTPELKTKVNEAMAEALTTVSDVVKASAGKTSSVDALKEQTRLAADGAALDKTVKGLDTDKSGSLDLKEAEAALKKMDLNGDGKVTKEEMATSLAKDSGIKGDPKALLKDDAMMKALAGLGDSLKKAGVAFDASGAASSPQSTPTAGQSKEQSATR